MEDPLNLALLTLAAVLLALFAGQTLRMRRMLGELVKREQRIEQATCNDQLTGLPNRRVFQEILGRELSHAKRTHGCAGLAILDVDDLKLVNDGLGVAAGDEVLERLARRLSHFTRGSDTLARLGGDQFALLITKCDTISDVLTAIYRLRNIWERPLFVRGREICVSCCIGLSVFPDDADGLDEILGHADAALAQAQERGFNSLCVFDEKSDRLSLARLETSQELRQAIGNGEFELHLQPQVSLADGALVGAEALIRWHHPERGLLTAAEFVPLAEQMGLMPETSSWVLEEICRQCSEWRAAGRSLVPISVNVSVRHFQAGDVPKTVAGSLERSGLDPKLLQIEVTESAALHDIDMMTEQFQRLRELGVGLQLDDFGTGYSSLSYLMRYPLNVIKIDRSFVTRLHEREQSVAIVRATLAMAHSLGLEVVAEGVETEGELRCLVELGCRTAQGYLLGRPMPYGDFEKILAAGAIDLPDTRAA